MEKIEQKLDSVFSKQNRIDNQLKTGSSTVLTHKLEFREASRPHSSFDTMLKGKYTSLTPSAGTATTQAVKKSPNGGSNAVDDGEGLPQPAVVLFPADKLEYGWRFSDGGAGLMNCGNTCFLNAVMQCLIHTPPLTNYLLSGDHFAKCKLYSREKCILCNMQMLMKRSLTGATDSISPKWFINNLQYIGRHFRSGRQEDAHEFLRLSLEKMQKCALVGVNHSDKYIKETTVINQIFGGFLRSQVVCLKCRARSNTYDPVLDISLDIKNVDSIERAFAQFVAPDKLDMDNAYRCDKCKQKVPALKRFTIHKSPNVLTIQLKRFQFAQSSFFGGGGKLSKHIKYPARLNIRPYMSNKNGPPEMYGLFATIQHEGYSCQSGHYVANARCGQKWYHFNDSMKRRISSQQCLNESSAYVLFYVKETGLAQPTPQSPAFKSHMQEKVKQNGSLPFPSSSKFVGPVKPQVIATPGKHSNKPFTGFNGIQTKTNGIAQTKVNGVAHTKTNGVASHTKTNGVVSHTKTNGVVSSPSPVAPLAEREKVRLSFGSKPSNTAHEPATKNNHGSPDRRNNHGSPDGKHNHGSPKRSKPEVPAPATPRLVMKIKDGKSITIETSPDGMRKILSDDERIVKMNEKRQKKLSKKSRLVPYADDSSSDSDWGSKHSSATASSSHSPKPTSDLVFDQRLNATTSVPGNTYLYETAAVKDRLNNHANNGSDTKSTKTTPSTPVKKPLTEVLTCVTTPTPSKHAGGGEWHTTSEAMLSPSVGSHSSLHSNTSTSDWAVSNNAKQQASSDKKLEGWTVTPGKNDPEKRASTVDNTSKAEVKVNGELTERKEHVGCSKSSTNLKRQVMQEKMRSDDVAVVDLQSPTTNDKACLLDNDIVKDRSDNDLGALYKKVKKHKKHKKHRHEERERSRDDYKELTEEDHEELRHKKKKKKKKKHKHRHQESEDEHKSHPQDDHVKRKLEREYEDTSHKRKAEREYTDTPHKRKVEKEFTDTPQNRKVEKGFEDTSHKRKDREFMDAFHSRKVDRGFEDTSNKRKVEREFSDAFLPRKVDREYDTSHNRKAEKGYEDTSQNAKLERGYEDGSHTKHRRDRMDHEDGSYKRRRVDSESSSEFEWVEKKAPAPLKTTTSLPGTPSQSWDHYTKDGHRKSSSGANTPVKTWDGLKTSNVVSQLEKLSKYGYGTQVLGWDGQKSHMDVERGAERGSRKRLSDDDDYDEEFDRGKVKKVKLKQGHEQRFNGNIFQDEQNRRNKDRTIWSDIKVGDNNPFFKNAGPSPSASSRN